MPRAPKAGGTRINTIQFIHEGLGNSSYLIGLPGREAVLVDPDRTTDRYLSAAEACGWTITHVLESHVHADFVSGARELAWTHGGGSFCSSGGGTKRMSTLGEERQGNPLFQFTGEDAFADWFPATFPAAPSYFFRMRGLNQAGPALVREIAQPPALDPGAFDAIRRHALVVDTRLIEEFMAGHIPGALSNAFRPAYSVWLGWLVPADTPLAFVAGEGSLPAVIGESLLVGYENFAGWLSGGMRAWEHAGMSLSRGQGLNASEVTRLLKDGARALDVREMAEHAAGHIPGSIHIPLGELVRRAGELPADRPVVAYCGHGERAVTATSILEGAGLQSPSILLGGFGAWEKAGYQIGRPA